MKVKEWDRKKRYKSGNYGNYKTIKNMMAKIYRVEIYRKDNKDKNLQENSKTEG